MRWSRRPYRLACPARRGRVNRYSPPKLASVQRHQAATRHAFLWRSAGPMKFHAPVMCALDAMPTAATLRLNCIKPGLRPFGTLSRSGKPADCRGLEIGGSPWNRGCSSAAWATWLAREPWTRSRLESTWLQFPREGTHRTVGTSSAVEPFGHPVAVRVALRADFVRPLQPVPWVGVRSSTSTHRMEN